MKIGIFENVFAGPSFAQMLDGVRASGAEAIQLNLASAGLPPMPDELSAEAATSIGVACASRGISIAAVNGTFNMCHPDPAERVLGLKRLAVIAAAARHLGTPVVTLCTGTRNRDGMWRKHPDNNLPDAWHDLVEVMAAAAQIAETHNVTLAFETEVANVVDSAVKSRRLIDEIGSPRLKVVMDGANIFHTGELPRMREMLDEAFDLLGNDIALAHAKDLDRDGEAGHLAAGHGLLDYGHYIGNFRRVGYDGAIILHGLTEPQSAGCIAFLRGHLDAT